MVVYGIKLDLVLPKGFGTDVVDILFGCGTTAVPATRNMHGIVGVLPELGFLHFYVTSLVHVPVSLNAFSKAD